MYIQIYENQGFKTEKLQIMSLQPCGNHILAYGTAQIAMVFKI